MKKTHSPYIQNLIKELSEDKMPKITIVTATYNLIKAGRKEFFKKCIESIYSQTYKNFEHIIIDGASDDGTLDLIKEIAPRSTVISEPDKGIYDAFNKGVKKASGEYVHFLNSDDYYTDKKSLEISASSGEIFAETRLMFFPVPLMSCLSCEARSTLSKVSTKIMDVSALMAIALLWPRPATCKTRS